MAGRRISPQDEPNDERVVIVGYESETQLFLNFNPVGATIMMASYPYKVVSVLKKKQQNGSDGDGSDSFQLLVPYSAMAGDLSPQDKNLTSTRDLIGNLAIQRVSAVASPATILETLRILATRHHDEPSNEQVLWI